MTQLASFFFIIGAESARLRNMPRGFYMLNPRNIKNVYPIDASRCRIEYVERTDRYVVPKVLICGAGADFVVSYMQAHELKENAHRTLTLIDNNGVSHVKSVPLSKLAYIQMNNNEDDGRYTVCIEENGSMKYYGLDATMFALTNIWDTDYVEDGTPYEYVPYGDINPKNTLWDINGIGGIAWQITDWGDADDISVLVNLSAVPPYELQENVDYVLLEDVITVLNAYAAGYFTASGETARFLVNLNDGTGVWLDVTTFAGATLAPLADDWDISDDLDVDFTIDWGDEGTEVTAVYNNTKDEAVPETTGYTVVGDTLTLKRAYIGATIVAPADELSVTVTFDDGSQRTIVLTGVA